MDAAADIAACDRCLDLGKRNRHLVQQVAHLVQRNKVLRRGRQKDQGQIRKLQSSVARLEQELREARGEARATASN